MDKYSLHGWTTNTASGVSAVVVAVPIEKAAASKRLPPYVATRHLRNEPEAIVALGLLVKALTEDVRRDGCEVAELNLTSRDPREEESALPERLATGAAKLPD